MTDLIDLKSKGYEKNFLKRLKKPDGTESRTYVLKVTNYYIVTGVINGRKYIEPTGGPMIMEGSYLEEAEATVKSIDYTMGYGYTITFEK